MPDTVRPGAPPPTIPATCLVMAGGGSTRFGSDKLTARLGAATLLEHVVGRMAPWFADTVVVHAPGPDLELKLPWGEAACAGEAVPPGGEAVPPGGSPDRRGHLRPRQAADPVPDGGPLVGLVAGLEAAQTEWAFVVGGDMPLVDRGLLDELWEGCVGAPGAPDAVVVHGPRGLEPLCAFYRGTALPSARATLDRGERRMSSFLRGLAVLEISETSARRVDPDLASLFNVNTPDDLASVLKRLEGS